MRIITRSFAVDRESYLRAIWPRSFAYDVWRLLAGVAFFSALVAVISWPAGIVFGFAWTCFFLWAKYVSDRKAVFSPAYVVPVFAPRNMEITEVLLRTHAANGITSAIRWSDLRPAERRGNFTILCGQSGPTLTIPDTAFKNPHNLAEFVAFVGASCGWKSTLGYVRVFVAYK